MKIGAQRDKTSEGFDPSAWASIGDATANEEDSTQIQPEREEDEIEDEAEITEETEDTQEGSEGKENKPATEDDDASEDQGDEEVEYELDEKEADRISSEIKKANPNLSKEDLEKKINEAKKSRLDELVKEQNNEYQTRLNKAIEDLKKDEKNKDKKDEELQKLAEDKLDEEDRNPFNTVEFSNENENVTTDFKTLAGEISIDGENLTIEENTVEAFQSALNKKIDAIRGEQEEFNKLDPTIKDMFRYVQENGIDALEKWLNPSKDISNLLALPEDALMYKAVESIRKQNGEDASKEAIEKEIEDMKEDGSYVKNLRDVKTSLRVRMDNARQEQLDRHNALKRDAEASETERINKLHENVRAHISNMKKYLDTYDIPEAAIKNILKNITPESVKRHQNDPEYLADSMIMRMFGSKLFKGAVESASNKSKDRSLRARRNADAPLLIKKKVTSNSAGANGNDQKKEGWDRWKIN